jgi:NitT/TauT family transport system substrate-binding protein
MKAESDQEFEALKAGFRGGIPRPGTAGTIADTEQLYRLLAEYGGDALLGVQTHFDENAFWNSSRP